MTAINRQTRLAAEQQQIRDAIERLLAGTPQRSNGNLTVATLAAESDRPRQRIYEHHADLVTEFRTKAQTGGPVTASILALQRQLADAHQRVHTLEAAEAQLKAKITTLCAVIAELTLEAHADNVIALRPE